MTDFELDTSAEEPEAIERAETAWIKISIGVLALFLVGVGIVTAINFGVVPYTDRRAPVEELLRGEFDHPRVVQTGDNEYAIYVLGKTWEWQPDPIRVPAQADLTFYVTSADLIHGFAVEGTTINVMAIPSDVSIVHFRFEEPGEYRMMCNEYCGSGHSMMTGKLIVEERK